MMNSLCGFRLNTAGVVIGWLGAALSLIATVIFGVVLSRIDDLAKAIFDNIEDTSVTEEIVRQSLILVVVIYLALNLLNLIASALLVAGTIKERHLMLIPWLISYGVSLCVGVLYFIYFVISPISSGVPFGSVVVSLISAGLSLAIHFVIWYAIYSLYKQIQQGREQRQHLLQTTGSSYPSYTKI